MKCTTSRQAETREGTTTVTVERDGATLVMKGVPALVCPNCGEDYVSEEIADRIHAAAVEVAGKGVKVEVRQYAA
ncbi:MAG: type II toxin-antitoxin system MqsA family antitoxin [Gemmatimonadetes bacterium]|nr:type II toxin-antitoxin system MqsA family antitoxin [Gemmatimonadota bacterium]